MQLGSSANLKPLLPGCVWESVDTVNAGSHSEPETQERHWLDLAKHGDQTAFSCLVEAYQRPVYNLAHRMLGNSAEAEEAAQETFVRMYTKLHTFDADRRLASWVLSIASHYCIDRLRRRRINWFSLDDDSASEVLSSDDPGPEESVIFREECAEIQQFIAALEPGYRAPLILRYWQGLSYDDIAKVMGISVSAVKSRLHRARLQIAGQVQARAMPAAAATAMG